MRKITQDIKMAFDSGIAKSVGNTTTDGTSVFLHGNKIIERRDDGVYVTLAGWPTNTTRERINGITNAGFHQVNRKPMRNGEPCDENAWYKL